MIFSYLYACSTSTISIATATTSTFRAVNGLIVSNIMEADVFKSWFTPKATGKAAYSNVVVTLTPMNWLGLP